VRATLSNICVNQFAHCGGLSIPKINTIKEDNMQHLYAQDKETIDMFESYAINLLVSSHQLTQEDLSQDIKKSPRYMMVQQIANNSFILSKQSTYQQIKSALPDIGEVLF